MRRRVSSWLRQGITLRRACAGTLLVLGAGRLGLFPTQSQAHLLSITLYGWLLVGCGVALLLTEAQRRHRYGRGAGFLAACLLATMAADVGVLGMTLMLFTWWAVCCAVETAALHD